MTSYKIAPPKPFKGEVDMIDEWLFVAKNFIQGNKIDDGAVFPTLVPYLEGSALTWASTLTTPLANFEEFQTALKARFPAVPDSILRQQWLEVEHKGKLDDYVTNFTAAAKKVKAATEQEKTFHFINGLKGKLKQEVLLSGKHFQTATTRNQPSKKLTERWHGPYKVLQRIGVVAYKLEFPKNMKIPTCFMYHS